MGSGFTVVCSNCGWDETYGLGIGMMYYPGNNELLTKLAPQRQRNRVRALLSESPPNIISYWHGLYVCPQCNTLHKRFYIMIEKDSCTLYETHFRCARCRSTLVEVCEDIEDMDVTTYNCRCCGQQTLEKTLEMYWD